MPTGSKSDEQITEGVRLLLKQLTVGERLSKIKTNTDKLGQANLTFDIVKMRLDLLEKYWAEVLAYHRELNLHKTELADEEYFVDDLFSDYENQYILTKVYFTGKLSGYVEQAQQRQVIIPGLLTQVDLRPMSSSVPKLKRPSFDGKQESWETFKEGFSAMFKDDPSLMPNLKLQHLISCLEGDAARRLANFKVTGANFDVAWQALSRRYDNKRMRLSTQLNLFINMPQATKRSVNDLTMLLDTVGQCKRALQSLKRTVDHWDDWFIQLTVCKLDSRTREDWETSLEDADGFPDYERLVNFLENRIKSLDAAHSNDTLATQSKMKPLNPKAKSFSAHHTTASATGAFTQKGSAKSKVQPPSPCLVCQGAHFINYCPVFTKARTSARLDMAHNLQLCLNCLRSQHTASSCTSKYRCKTCGANHHSLLHEDKQDTFGGSNSTNPAHSSKVQSYTAMLGCNALLGTAIVTLTGKSGDELQVRALIDPGSEGSFVTERLAQCLRLAKTPLQIAISGMGGETTAQSTASVHLCLKSKVDSNFALSFSAAVIPKLTALLPRYNIARYKWEHLQDLLLADPGYSTPAPVDCILGAEIYAIILLQGLRKGPIGSPIAHLGWILTGPVNTKSEPVSLNSFNTTLSIDVSLSDQLRRFWELEQPSIPTVILSPEEEACERHFISTHTRDETGRYIVRLPFRSSPEIVNSREVATRRLFLVERRLERDENLRASYVQFMQEFEDLGHMQRVSAPRSNSIRVHYIPHHAVVRRDSGKLRVVFDASQAKGSAQSLNAHLHSGPKLQSDIMVIIARWRLFLHVLTADIVKMFRQVSVHPDDTDWQRVVWRSSPAQRISDYKLLTVTYGTTCAPYLANRVLLQLTIDEGQRFPLGANVLRRHMYVDDAFAGAHSLDNALQVQKQLCAILATAGMSLDKWAANNPKLLKEHPTSSSSVHVFEPEDTVTTLGLRWSPVADVFSYSVQPPNATTLITKRTILSEISRLYDPLGWLSPIIVRAKLLLQQLWITGKDWDTPVDSATRASWLKYREELPELQGLNIPRWMGTSSESMLQLCCYCAIIFCADGVKRYFSNFNIDQNG